MKTTNKKQILEGMINLIKDGEQIASVNDSDFSEFAEYNNFDIETVKEVYSDNEEELCKLYNEIHS